MNDRELQPGSGEHGEVADELFVHGLLRAAAEDSAATNRRVAAVMAAIAEPVTVPRRPRWPWLLAGAAAVLAVVAFMALRGGDGAGQELWNRALQATQRAGDRRYHVRAAWSSGELGLAVTGEIDVRDAAHYVFRADVEGTRVAIGADGGEMWLAGDPQLVQHLRAHRRSRGPFAMDGTGALFGSVDALLAAVPAAYVVRVMPETDGALAHLVAERVGTGPIPTRVEAWLDAAHVMQRVAMFWSAEPEDVPRRRGEIAGDHFLELNLVPGGPFPAGWFQAERYR